MPMDRSHDLWSGNVFPPSPAAPPARPLRRFSFPWVPMLAVALTLYLVLQIGQLVIGNFSYLWINPGRVVTPRGELAPEEKATIQLYQNNRPCVVHITALTLVSNNLDLNVQRVPEGTGSGFVWDQAGHIVTNFHVIQHANGGVQVTLADNTTWPASIVGAYPDKDIAVLHITAPPAKLRPITIGTSDDLEVGQRVFAIGNPFGLDQTLTTGIISAVGREIESVTKRPLRNVIQTDAAINPGNSGGPLLDSSGRLIGINTAIFSPSGSSSGIGFAIPVDEVNRNVPLIIKNGKVARPGLGVELAADQVARQLVHQDGALIITVQPGSPAEQAGLRPSQRDANGGVVPGDLIQSFDGKPISKVNDLFSALDGHKVGDVVKIGVLRDGKTTNLTATLAEVQ